MRLSLERLGWHMPSFTMLVDDMGVEVSLTLVWPALLKRLLRRAAMRSPERTGIALVSAGERAWMCPWRPCRPASSLRGKRLYPWAGLSGPLD
eukprot:2613517-Pyramimonas_sp.AAC.1